MPTIITTPADLRLSDNAQALAAVAGEAVVPFEILYTDSNSKMWLASNADATSAAATGIAVSYAAADGRVAYIPLTPGIYIESASAIWAAGLPYYVGDTPGTMFDASDVGSGDVPTVLGIAITTTKLQIINSQTGIAL